MVELSSELIDWALNEANYTGDKYSTLEQRLRKVTLRIIKRLGISRNLIAESANLPPDFAYVDEEGNDVTVEDVIRYSCYDEIMPVLRQEFTTRQIVAIISDWPSNMAGYVAVNWLFYFGADVEDVSVMWPVVVKSLADPANEHWYSILGVLIDTEMIDQAVGNPDLLPGLEQIGEFIVSNQQSRTLNVGYWAALFPTKELVDYVMARASTNFSTTDLFLRNLFIAHNDHHVRWLIPYVETIGDLVKRTDIHTSSDTRCMYHAILDHIKGESYVKTID